MATVEFDPEAYEALLRLYESDPTGADVVDGWLDALEADPGQAAVRRRRLGPPDLWYIPFHLSSTADWMILWELQGETVVIRHLGPNVL